MQVLRQTTIADGVEAKDSLDHQKAVFHPDPNSGLGSIARFLLWGERTSARFLMGKVLRLASMLANNFALASIGRVAPYATLVTM